VRVLLDEQVPRQLASHLAGHEVRTIQQERRVSTGSPIARRTFFTARCQHGTGTGRGANRRALRRCQEPEGTSSESWYALCCYQLE